MLRYFGTLNRLLEKWIFVVILSSMAIGYLFSSSLVTLKPSVSYFFGYMTFATALGCSWNEFRRVLRSPLPILMALGLLHIVHPVVARLLGTLMHGAASPYTVAMVLGAAVPVGVTSVIWAGMIGGNVPLSLTIVTIDTLLAPLLVPLTVLLFAGRSVAFDVSGMMVGLLKMIVIPTVLGVAINDMTRGVAGKALRPYLNPFSKLSLGCVVAINVAAAGNEFSAMGSAWVLVLISLGIQSVFGYVSSYFASRWAGFDDETTLTITYSAGIRNISAGIVIAMAYFPAKVAVPVVLSMLFQQPLATVTSRILKARGMVARPDALRQSAEVR